MGSFQSVGQNGSALPFRHSPDIVSSGSGIAFPPCRIPVTILGATGVVGQRFLRRLARHPLFEPVHLAASDRSVGKAFREACSWHLDGKAWAGFGDMPVVACTPEDAFAPVVFSALDTEPARNIEPLFAKAGALVFSNASAFRMESDVPLLIPEINSSHLRMLATQRAVRGWSGGIVTNPNCTTVMLAAPLAPLDRAFGIEAVIATSMQAITGAGYPGVPAMDISGNVIPYIRHEEPKVETESNKILGTIEAGHGGIAFADAGFAVSATCTRVPVLEGHTIAVSVRLRGDPSPEAVRAAMESFVPDTTPFILHSAPRTFLAVSDLPDRPQPRREAEVDDGMRVTVGRIRPCPIMGVKYVCMGNNTERGAAGASVLNAELACAMGYMNDIVSTLSSRSARADAWQEPTRPLG